MRYVIITTESWGFTAAVSNDMSDALDLLIYNNAALGASIIDTKEEKELVYDENLVLTASHSLQKTS